MKLGLSGHLTRAFIGSPITPLLVLAALLLGLIALSVLPREEDPQIHVPLVDIMVRADGLKAVDAAELVTKPLEEIVKGIGGVEHVYSLTEDDRVIVTARFFVGTNEDEAVARVHEKVRANLDQIPIGIPEPLIVGRGINDVAIVVLTLSPKPEAASRWNDLGIYQVADALRAELIKVKDVGFNYLVGGRPGQIRIEPDPERLALYGVTLNQLVAKIQGANRTFLIGSVRRSDQAIELSAGQTLSGAHDIGLLLITTHDGRPVYVRDVAKVVYGGKPLEARVWDLRPDGQGGLRRLPAVSIAFAKRAGSNAVVIASRLIERLARLRGRVVPDDLNVKITRNYGRTARDKANELLFHLLLATLSIVAIIAVSIGWRESLVALVVIPTTILLTLFSAWLMGYTLNRVSLFALIFAIGILTDDAIVVIESIHRHWRRRAGRSLREATIDAVAEVGNPTVIATLTVVMALLPMMFVSGLMGPYMSPIPANASAAMLFSFLIAVTITPWLMIRLSGSREHQMHMSDTAHGALARIYLAVARRLLRGRWRSALFLAVVVVATGASMTLLYSRDITVKLLPFDNKSEMQVVVDLPGGASLERTERVLMALAERLTGLPELAGMQLYAGTAAPFNFNGLVRHYYLRSRPEQGQIQVNLVAKNQRSRASHAIALEVRKRLATVPTPAGTTVKVVEVPPGPPVISTLLAEVYGPDGPARRAAARRVRAAFESVPYIVDVGDSLGHPAKRLRVLLDRDNLEFHGVDQAAVYDTLKALLGGVAVGYSHRGGGRNPIEIAIALPKHDQFLSERLLTTPVPGEHDDVELGDLVSLRNERASYPIFRHNGRNAVMVMGELAGRFEAPLYGMIAVGERLGAATATTGAPAIPIKLHGQPTDESHPTLLWDGEWEITWVTFRDMGIAFGIALLGIYLLVVGQFGSFRVPLVILVPVPLTIIGILFGHWLFGAPFTATSMIGFIALAGIIVRNSILLVDFIQNHRDPETPLREVLLEAGAVRFKPILLTALAAMVGAVFILSDPIFQGLAISLLFGLASSTLLTVLVIPALYVLLRDDRRPLGSD